MAKRHELTITIDDQGTVTVEVSGVSGPACEALTKDLEDDLGTVRARRRTSEYYQTAPSIRQKHDRA